MPKTTPPNKALTWAKDEIPPLDRVLSSSGRIRILTLLSQVEQLHLTEIAKRTEQSYSAAERHLDDLSEAGLWKKETTDALECSGLTSQTIARSYCRS